MKKKYSDFSELRSIISSNETIKVTYSRNDKIEIINLKTVKGKIGIKGTVETRKLNFLNSCITSVVQFYNFVKDDTYWYL